MFNKYNVVRPHFGKYCYDKTPIQTFLNFKNIVINKSHGFNSTKSKFANLN